MKTLVLGILAIGLTAATPAFAQIHKEAVVREIAPLIADTFRDRGDGVLWEGQVSAPGAFYVRLRFSDVTSPPGAQYTVVVRKASNRHALARYSASAFTATRTFDTRAPLRGRGEGAGAGCGGSGGPVVPDRTHPPASGGERSARPKCGAGVVGAE